MYFVYILKSVEYRKSYVGIANNIQRRLHQHNNGYHIYTKRYIPWKVIYVEECKDRIVARKREKYLKSAVGRRWMKKNIFND